MKIFLSIIIPIYNEQDRIENTIKKITDYLSIKNYYYEIILVNDGSSDDTANIINNIKINLKRNIKNYNILILNNNKNMGKGFSVRKGILSAKGNYILFSDADLSTPIDELENLIKYLQNGYNIAIGSRGLKDSKIIIRQNKGREYMGKLFNIFVKLITKLKYSDTQCGFKCFDRKAVDSIFPYLKINDFSFDVEILYLAEKLGLKVKEAPIHWANSVNSKVRITKDPINMFMGLLKIRKLHKDFNK